MPISPINEVPESYYSSFQVLTDEETLDGFGLFLKSFSLDFFYKLFSFTYAFVEDDLVKGYVSICTGSVKSDYVEEEFDLEIPYNQSPAILIGKLAVDKNFRREGIGSQLYDHALSVCLETIEKISARFLIVHSIKKQETIEFWEKFGFINVHESKDNITLVLDIENLLK